MPFTENTDGVVQDGSVPIANTLHILQSCTKQSKSHQKNFNPVLFHSQNVFVYHVYTWVDAQGDKEHNKGTM